MKAAIPVACGILAALTLMAPSMSVSAQTTRQQAPEANVWGGFEHQPTEAEVQEREKSDDIGRTQQQRREGDDEVENIYNELMNGTKAGGAADTAR